MPLKEDEKKINEKENLSRTATVVKMLIMPQVLCIIMFIIVACIIERRKLVLDPLNFSTLNVIFEVVRYKIFS
jgi:competence protein ComGC